ncbi:efflux RND transporter periplasmic adaptor subunit [Arcticibacter eurypsychrophilus]|uniref:efflux RND transporter periplasmic adaptor subunit n=1 Tax=Arcticibacter eurypsychrophilus TaxID=1434752 RepID=UPI00084D7B06|nr:efflux RND transporter periplasmic adaptor subunit [Arcticibacter eurypsychrophilus]
MKTTILLSLFLAGCAGKTPQVEAPAPQSLPVVSIKSSTETTYTEYPAAIQGAVDLEIRPQVSGVLDKIYVNEGALVKKGDPLFKLNGLSFKEALNNAQASLLAAQASVTNARIEIDKLTPLVKNKVVSDFQLRSAQATYESAQARVKQARAEVAAANINLDYTLIKAPVNGYVGLLPKKQGSLVSTTDPLPLTQLSDVHEVHVYFSLGEDDFADFNTEHPGGTLAEKLKGLPGVSLVLSNNSVYPQEGKIDMVDGQFDKQTGSILLRATFANQQGLLRSGNTGKIRLSLQHQNTLLIPQASTVEVQDKMFVFTVDKSNKVSKRPITVSGTSGTNYLVNNGLASGDRIVVDGIDKIKEGDIIQPQVFTAENNKTASR